MNKSSALAFALALACAGAAFAAPESGTVKDPDTGITLHAPRHDSTVPATPKQKQLAVEAKEAMQRVATATKRVVRRADQALRDAVGDGKA